MTYEPDREVDMEAQRRGGDSSQGMDGEGDPEHATMSEVIYWVGIYTDILGMEENVLARVKELMASQPPRARREVELTNVPVIRAQVKRFRERLTYWEERYEALDGGRA